MSNSKLIAAAAAALAAAPGANAIAADAAASEHNDLNVSVEGGILVSDFSKSSDFLDNAPKLGDFADPPYDLGGYGAISIGKNFQDSAFDWKLSGSITEFMANERSDFAYYDGEYVSASEVNDFDFQAVDMDLGNTFSNETASGRVFAGIRVLNSHDSSGVNFSFYDNVYGNQLLDVNIDGKFLGVGPRVGMDLRVGGSVGLVGNVSAAAVFGRNSFDASYAVDINYGGESVVGEAGFNDVDWDWVTDVSASAGLSVRPSEDAELIVGYRVEQINDIRSASAVFGGDENVLEHGPMLKLNVKF